MDTETSNVLPKVVVLMSTYNGELFLSEQLDSLFAQANVNLYLIVRDDGSTDRTKEILETYLRKKPDKMKVLFGENIGFSKSFYTLVENSGDYDFFAFSDQDDVWFPNKLEQEIKKLLENKLMPSMCFCNCWLTDEKLIVNKPLFENIQLPKQRYNRILENLAAGFTIVFNKAARDMFLKADKDKIEFHDFWLYSICSLLGSVIYNESILAYYRQHSNNYIGKNRDIYKKILYRINRIRNGSHLRENIASELLRCFGEKIDSTDKDKLRLIASYRDTLNKRLKLLFSSEYTLGSFKKNLMFKIHIILGDV